MSFKHCWKLLLLVLICAGFPVVSNAQSLPPPSQPSASDSSADLGAATLSVDNPGILLGVGSTKASERALEGTGKTQGFQFKDPILSSGFSYRNSHDSSTPSGFHADEYNGDVSLDADIYDGLIAGALATHMSRDGHNSLGTTESLNANGISLYLAKRFFELMNVGVAYNFMANQHRLAGTTAANLDSYSNGFTSFVGVSDKIDNWFLASTISFVYAHDDYDVQNNLDTGMLSAGGEVNYDVTDWFSPGIAFSYNRYLIQDTFSGSALDKDYWSVGPRLTFYATDAITVHLDGETWQGYTGYDSYKIRIGMDYAF